MEGRRSGARRLQKAHLHALDALPTRHLAAESAPKAKNSEWLLLLLPAELLFQVLECLRGTEVSMLRRSCKDAHKLLPRAQVLKQRLSELDGESVGRRVAFFRKAQKQGFTVQLWFEKPEPEELVTFWTSGLLPSAEQAPLHYPLEKQLQLRWQKPSGQAAPAKSPRSEDCRLGDIRLFDGVFGHKPVKPEDYDDRRSYDRLGPIFLNGVGLRFQFRLPNNQTNLFSWSCQSNTTREFEQQVEPKPLDGVYYYECRAVLVLVGDYE